MYHLAQFTSPKNTRTAATKRSSITNVVTEQNTKNHTEFCWLWWMKHGIWGDVSGSSSLKHVIQSEFIRSWQLINRKNKTVAVILVFVQFCALIIGRLKLKSNNRLLAVIWVMLSDLSRAASKSCDSRAVAVWSTAWYKWKAGLMQVCFKALFTY
jgi:hypothetical protein